MTWNVPPENRKTGGVSGQVRPIPITPSVELVLRDMQLPLSRGYEERSYFPGIS
jgi:hypothetical protein